MRNLKKILALVLALVMSLSLMITANAFKDDEKISGDYAEAVEVLDGLGVFQGYEDGSFQPQGKITRAEVAAIIYRIVTGDVKDNQVAIYSDYNKFTDTNEAKWAAGYIGFCANAEYIKGYGDGKFGPNDQVTGYQALAMILRAVGYDVNGEFTGTGWQVQVASTAKKLGILENVVEGTLGTPATREVVAEILFQTITKAPQVEYTLAFGYQPVNYKGLTKTLGEATFQLVKGDRTEIDKWGRPGYYWFAYSNKTVVATIEESYKAQYETAVTECQVAQDAKFTGTKTYTMYVNGVKSTDVLQATDTVDTIGAQGRQTEVYSDRIVMIDTLLALVTDVKDATYDAAGHLKTPSKITLCVYDANTATYATGDTYVMTNGATNYGYAAGNMVLLNAYTVFGNRDTAGVVSKDATSNVGVYGEILGLADAVDGTQTVVWFNTGKHTVNGTTYDNAAEFHLDEAGSKTNNYTWYFDQFGNIIGNVEVATQYTYAVMTSIWWTNDASNGAGVAKATLKYMDGTDNTVTLSSVTLAGVTKAPRYSIMSYTGDLMDFDEYATYFEVSTNAAVNATADNATGYADLIHGHLFQVATLADGSVALTEVNNGATPTPAHTELATNVSIINRYGYITATEGNVAIDTETKFLVRGTSEASAYVTYTGLNELPTFKAGAVVDYVLGAGGVADYVYIIGETVDSNANNFVLVTGNAYSAVLKTIGGVSYWELTLPVPAEDGSVATLKILDSDANMTTVPANVITLTNTANHGKLFYVATTNGFVAERTGVTEITNNVFSYGTTGRAVMLTDAKMLTGVAGGVINGTVNGTVANVRFNVTSSTVVVGTLAADMTDKVVYVIYSSTNNDAAKVYVLDINSTIDPIAPTTVNSISVVGAHPVAGVQLGALTSPEASKVTFTAKWYDRTTGTYVEDTQIAIAGHEYTVVVTDVAAKAGYVLGTGFTVSGFTSTIPGTWTYNF